MNWIKIVEAFWKFLGLSEYEPKVKNYIVVLWLIIIGLLFTWYMGLKYYDTQDKLCEAEKRRIVEAFERKIDTLEAIAYRLNIEVKNEIRNCQSEVKASTNDYIELLKEISKIKRAK